jgi:hypothetical protein
MLFKLILQFLLLALAHSFAPSKPRTTKNLSSSTALLAADTWSGQAASGGAGGAGSMEQIEFKIYPDGRVEETVRGVKGNNCHKVTEKINEMLGEVVATRPTEEMFEQEVSVSETLYNKDTSSGWEGSTW